MTIDLNKDESLGYAETSFELAKLKSDPSYTPNFFGADVNPNVLFK